MSQSIKISDEEMNLVRPAAKLHSRSVAGQVEHWLRIGRAIEQSKFFSYQNIKNALLGLKNVDDLSLEEQEVYFQELDKGMWESPTEAEQTEFKRSLGNRSLYGLDESGKIIVEQPPQVGSEK